MKPLVSIIIVGYNSKKYLKDCFDSILTMDYKKIKVIFVDNNSSDESVQYIKNRYPKTVIINSDKNLGFAGGNNLGIKKALEYKSDYLFLLNPDTIIDKKCLSLLIKTADEKTIRQPLVLIYKKDKTDKINTAGNHLNFLGISYCGEYNKNASEAKNDNEIPSASGSALLVPRKILHKIGLLDPSFFMYHEDLDLCWRAHIAGFKVKLNSRARVWHKYEFSRNKNKYYYIERNRLFFLIKNFQLKTLILIAPMFIINEILMIVWSIISGWFLLKLKSYYDVIRSLKKLISQRKTIENLRKTNDNKLKDFIGYEVNFSEAEIPLLGVYGMVMRFYWSLIYYLV